MIILIRLSYLSIWISTVGTIFNLRKRFQYLNYTSVYHRPLSLMRSSSTPTVVSCGEHSYLRFLRHKTHIRPQSLHTRTRLLSSKNCSTTFFKLLLLYTPSLIRAFLLFRQLFLGPHPFCLFSISYYIGYLLCY